MNSFPLDQLQPAESAQRVGEAAEIHISQTDFGVVLEMFTGWQKSSENNGAGPS
jgi:hypothetical protein